MTRFAVVAAPIQHAEAARRLLPAICARRHSADRAYFLFAVDNGQDVEFDDADGHVLVEIHNFATVPEAHAWVDADARLRQLVARGTH